MIFFTSDLHFGHTNIIEYEKRPFADVREMDHMLIENWNAVVKTGDIVYILGDFSFYNKEKTACILSQLNGTKYLISGNHDNEVSNRGLFPWTKQYYSFREYGILFCLFHYPIQVWNEQHRGAIHLYGHIHSNSSDHHPMKYEIANSLNVGVDVNNYRPISIIEVLQKLNRDVAFSCIN